MTGSERQEFVRQRQHPDRLLRLMHRVADAGLVTSVLAALPDSPVHGPSRDRLLARPAKVSN
jgi:hypothetical protein